MSTFSLLSSREKLGITAQKSALTRQADDIAKIIVSCAHQEPHPDLFLDIPDIKSILIIIVTKKDARSFSISGEKLKAKLNGTRCEFKICLEKDLEEILNGIKTAGRNVLPFNDHRFK